jgi:hypothetical protein
MKKSSSQLRNVLYFLPRLVLWSICMLYIIITVVVSFDLFEPYLYPLEYLRSATAGRK